MSVKRWMCGCACVVATSIASPSLSAHGHETALTAGTAEPSLEGEAFRDQLLDFLDAVNEVSGSFGHAHHERLIAESYRLTMEMPVDNLAAISRRTASAQSDLSDVTRELRALAEHAQGLRRRSARNGPPRWISPTLGAPAGGQAHLAAGGASPQSFAGFPDRPPIIDVCDVIPHDPASVFTFQQIWLTAEEVLALATRACDEVIVVLGEGGNTSLACGPLEAFLIAAQIPYEHASFCLSEETAATVEGTYERVGHLHADLDQTRAEIIANDDANTAAIIANDDANTAAIIANDNANTAAIITELRALACDLIRLSNTPEGQRASSVASCSGHAGYPYNFPE